jgi:large subunit ribosomal protein L24
MKLKKGDDIKVVRGKDAGKSGKIERVLLKENAVVVTGMNQYKRHIKARNQNQTSEIITITKPLPVSNVMFHCAKCKKEVRLGYKIEKDKKIRICKNCGQKN